MSKYTAEEVDTFIVNTSKYLGVTASDMLTEYAAHLRERESAKVGVTYEMKVAAMAAWNATGGGTFIHGLSDLANMGSALEAVAPMLASARVPDGYTALLSDGKRYWSDKPRQHGEWFPYYLGNVATKPEKE